MSLLRQGSGRLEFGNRHIALAATVRHQHASIVIPTALAMRQIFQVARQDFKGLREGVLASRPGNRCTSNEYDKMNPTCLRGRWLTVGTAFQE